MTSHVRKQTPFSHLHTLHTRLFLRACANVYIKIEKMRCTKEEERKKQRRPIGSKSWVCAQHTYQSTRIDKINQIKPQSTNFGHYSSFPINPTNQPSILNIHIFCDCRQTIVSHLWLEVVFHFVFFTIFCSPKLTEK